MASFLVWTAAELAAVRIVSMYGCGDFHLTWLGTMLFDGNDVLVGGSLGFTYPVTQASASQPFASINQYFPALAMQGIPPIGTAHITMGSHGVGGHVHGGHLPKSVAPSDSPRAPSVSRFSHPEAL